MYDLSEILIHSVECRASDIHLSVGRAPNYRIDGVLHTEGEEKLKPDDVKNLIMPLLDERHKRELEESGQTDFAHAIPGVGRFRVNVFKQRGTLASVMRALPFEIPEPDMLGIPPEVVAVTEKKRGLVLVTGPTGSGKSTTLASIIDKINSMREVHVITLEDPIEYLHNHKKAMVNQREVGLDTHSYSNALRAALREDPDVILVGEMRDLETISTAITAAETGHLVLSTLHTIGAASTIDRIVDVFPPHQQQQIRVQLSMVLESVISQQLIPTADKKSRVAAFEVMHSTPAIKNLIREAKSPQINSTIQTSKKLGMQTMDDAIFDLYMKGDIDKENAVSYAQDSQIMEKRIDNAF